MRVKIVLFLYFLIAAVPFGNAHPIFSERRPDGSIVFTDKPKDPQASVKIDLPPLERYTPASAEQGGTLSSSKTESEQLAPATCYAHGGTDCTAGPDEDGSVICTDGFRGVRARFNLTCRQARLVINNAEYSPNTQELRVFVRNISQVPAYETVVFIKQKGAKKVTSEQVKLIEAFGIGEIIFNNLILLEDFKGKLVDNLVVSCQNCG